MILVTGGAGFIGTNFVRHLRRCRPETPVTVLDALTYAGNAANLDGLEGVRFVRGDIRTAADVEACMAGIDAIVHFAAESHVDRSILGAEDFISTNVFGTYVLLQAAHRATVGRIVCVSTDEVYGSVAVGAADESGALRPGSPYAASKASSDLMALAHHTTFGTPVMITRGSNTYGPWQYPEKLIPLFVTNGLQGLPLPLYGDGMNERDWLHVDDHCAGILTVLEKGEPGTVYNLAAEHPRPNREIALQIMRLLDLPGERLQFVTDRQGHDFRYSVDASRAHDLGWAPARGFDEGLEATVRWYRENADWWRPIKERKADFQQFYGAWYGSRLSG